MLQTETVHADTCYGEGAEIGENCAEDPGEMESCRACVAYICWLFADGPSGSPPPGSMMARATRRA